MVQKSKKQGAVFEVGTPVTLAILSKIRLSSEPKRPLCRVIERTRGRGSWTASELNGIDAPESEHDIPSYWPDNGPAAPLTRAVQLPNCCGTVASMHKPNRDATAERTKALALAAKALKIVASLAPPRDDPAGQLAQELA
jgi:hypothetical protein